MSNFRRLNRGDGIPAALINHLLERVDALQFRGTGAASISQDGTGITIRGAKAPDEINLAIIADVDDNGSYIPPVGLSSSNTIVKKAKLQYLEFRVNTSPDEERVYLTDSTVDAWSTSFLRTYRNDVVIVYQQNGEYFYERTNLTASVDTETKRVNLNNFAFPEEHILSTTTTGSPSKKFTTFSSTAHSRATGNPPVFDTTDGKIKLLHPGKHRIRWSVQVQASLVSGWSDAGDANQVHIENQQTSWTTSGGQIAGIVGNINTDLIISKKALTTMSMGQYPQVSVSGTAWATGDTELELFILSTNVNSQATVSYGYTARVAATPMFN